MARVLHVIAHLEKGGAERQLQLLLRASGHDHVVMVPAQNIIAVPFSVVPLSGLGFTTVLTETRRAIRDHDIDIVHLWLPERLTVPAALAARLEGCVVVSGDRRKARDRGLGAIRDRVQYVPHLLADRIVPNYPICRPAISLWNALGFGGRTQTILNGFETPVTAPDFQRPVTRILAVQRLIPQKRVDLLVDVIAARAGLTLDIVGDGPARAALEAKVAERAVGNRVTFHGRVDHWGRDFDPDGTILVLPSMSEGMSNVLFEAIAHGFPVLCRQTPELRSIVDTWSAKPATFDVDASLGPAIDDLLQLSPRDRSGRVRALQSHIGELSVARMAQQYDALYDALGRRAITKVEAL